MSGGRAPATPKWDGFKQDPKEVQSVNVPRGAILSAAVEFLLPQWSKAPGKRSLHERVMWEPNQREQV
jgi:hypothetical protein